MNYKDKHAKFIDYCKNTSPVDRLRKRNKNDERLYKDILYTENHHIVPKHNNGTDEEENMVKLLPEEHLFIHKLRYKAFKQRGDILAVRFCLNGLNNLSEGNGKSEAGCIRLSKGVLKTFAFIKQNSYDFRKNIGWQTEEGIKSISEHRKNTMPVKDLNNEIIGSVSIDHPKVLSGEWVHHSKGMVPVLNDKNEKVYITMEEYHNDREKYTYRGPSNKGIKNPRYIDITDEEIIEQHTEISKKIGFICSYGSYLEIANNNNNSYKKSPSIRNYRFDGNINNEYDIIKSKLPNFFIASKKGYTKEEKIKYFDGLNQKKFIKKIIEEGIFNDKN